MDEHMEALDIVRGYMTEDQLKHPMTLAFGALRLNVDEAKVSEPDRARLFNLSFTPDNQYGGFVSYEYGSANV